MRTSEETLASSGQHVIILTETATERRMLLDQVQQSDDIMRSNRTRGAERVTYLSGGSIQYIHAHSHGMRGRNADVLSVTPILYADRTVMDQALPCLATSQVGQVIIRLQPSSGSARSHPGTPT